MSKHFDRQILDAAERLQKAGHSASELTPGQLFHNAIEHAHVARQHMTSTNPDEREFANELLAEAAVMLLEAAGGTSQLDKLGPVLPLIWP